MEDFTYNFFTHLRQMFLFPTTSVLPQGQRLVSARQLGSTAPAARRKRNQLSDACPNTIEDL